MTILDNIGHPETQVDASGQATQYIPGRPGRMEPSVERLIVERSGGKCEAAAENGCVGFCDTHLEWAHKHADSLGGPMSLDNMRLECRNLNRSYGAAPDPKWLVENYFDQFNSFEGLRLSQFEAGVARVQACGDLFVGDLARKLKQHVSVFAITCGGGKTVLMMSVCFAINQEIRKRKNLHPRIKNALFLEPEVNLCSGIRDDLICDLSNPNIGLHTRIPRIRVGDIDRPPLDNDVVISCPQSLWEREKGKEVRSDDEIRAILSKYDAIVFDEGDYARAQIERLVRLSPDAFKFSLTASPVDANGAIMKGPFVYAGMASYSTVYTQDNCLKPMLAWDDAVKRGFINAIPYNDYDELIKGEETRKAGKHGQAGTLHGSLATVRAAMNSVSDLEQLIQRYAPDEWWSPHIIIRVDTTDAALHLAAQINQMIERNDLSLSGDGWRACAIFDGISDKYYKAHRMHLPREETALVHQGRDLVHPFMRAKRNGGRCDEKSARILVVVNMATRGINNWPCQYLVDLRLTESISTQIQLLGRPVRWPAHLKHLFDHPEFVRMAHVRLFYPDWIEGAEEGIKKAWKFILSQDDFLKDVYLWSNMLDGAELSYTPDTSDRRELVGFTDVDKVDIAVSLNDEFTERDAITLDDVKRVVGNLKNEGGRSDRWFDAAVQYADESFVKNRQPIKFVEKPVAQCKIIAREYPKAEADYTSEEIIAFVRQAHPNIPDQALLGIENGGWERTHFAGEKRNHDLRISSPAPRIAWLWNEKVDGVQMVGVFNRTVINPLLTELKDRSLAEFNKDYGTISKACDAALREVFKVDGENATCNNGLLDLPAVHWELDHNHRRVSDIRRIAVNNLIKRGFFGNISKFMEAANEPVS